MPQTRAILLVATAVACALHADAADSPALHTQIDSLMEAVPGPRAAIAGDDTFARRASLDLIGRIPTRDELATFVDDDSPKKRAAFIDRLLSSPEYVDHMAVVFDVMLMERRGNKHVKSDEFRGYLREALAANRSYRDLVAEILGADGSNERVRPASAFYLERDVEPHLLTRDVGRVFFGVDLACAQCHDHPLINDYHQADYYGLHAFFVRSSLFQPDKKKPALIGETATGESDFKSVFTEREGRLGPRVPGGQELLEVSLKPTDQYEVAPAKNVRPVPKFSRRQQLAKALLESAPRQFDRNIVNRLWAHLFGRGLVDPVDLLHSDNPATHPEVLDLLADSFSDSNYDIKGLLREVMLTKAYQRDFRLPSLEVVIEQAPTRIAASTATTESAGAKLADAEALLERAVTELDEAIAKVKPLRDAETTANKAVSEAVKKRDAEQAKVTKTEGVLKTQQDEATLLAESAKATKAAVDTLKGDKELAAALATIETRIAAYAEARKKTEATLKAEQNGLAKMEAELVAASTKADQAIAARVEPERRVRDQREKMFAARDVVHDLRRQVSLAERELEYWKSLVAYDELGQREAELVANIDSSKEQVVASQKQLADAEVQAASTLAAATTAKEVAAAAQATRDAAQAELSSAKDVSAKLTASIAQANGALAKIETDESVSQAIDLLNESLKKANTKTNDKKATFDRATERLAQAKEAFRSAESTASVAAKAVLRLKARNANLVAAINDSEATLASIRQQTIVSRNELISRFAARGYIRELAQLTPEQLASSMLTATGYIDRVRSSANAAAERRLKQLIQEREKKAAEAAKGVAKPDAAKAAEASLPTREQLAKEEFAKARNAIVKRFVTLYGAQAGQPQSDFFATADQALFAANGGDLRSWLAPSGENLTGRLLAEEDVAKLADDTYESIVSRKPTANEIDDIRAYLAERPDKKREAVQELAWALLTSVEFRFQH